MRYEVRGGSHEGGEEMKEVWRRDGGMKERR